MKKLIVVIMLLIIFIFNNKVMAEDNGKVVSYNEMDLKNLSYDVYRMCAYDYCEDLINASNSVRLRDFRIKYLNYLDVNNKDDIKKEVLVRGLVITRVFYK